MNDLLSGQAETSGPVECLGKKFTSDAERREYFIRELAEKLRNPDFRAQDGFPEGTDDAILAMSDPPYYTACPNPWLKDFVEQRAGAAEESVEYKREPLSIDVSVGKFDSLYKAHSYHTKVPHLAIVPSILHYTNPGDVVLDGFCGSGMTGVAAQWCGSAPSEYRRQIEAECLGSGRPIPAWGHRRAVLADLSPAATYIASGYNLPVDVNQFELAATALLNEVDSEIGWMYQTKMPNGELVRIEYTVWSEVFVCHACSGEIIFERVAVDRQTFKIHDEIECPHCRVRARKEEMELQYERKIDPHTGVQRDAPKRVPSEIYYRFGGELRAKVPDEYDLSVLDKIALLQFPLDLPYAEFPDSQMLRVGRMATTKVQAISDLFVPRSAQAMALLWRKAKSEQNQELRRFLVFLVEQAIWGLSALNRYQPSQHLNYGGSQVNRQLNGVYYIASMYAECSPWHNLDGKVGRLVSAFRKYPATRGVVNISTSSASNLPLSGETIDYIFTDPPFGENIYYADLNFLVESWHRVTTRVANEAIVDRVREKTVFSYQAMMEKCFAEYYRVLKPGRWMTVVFSNSKAAVWNAIQVALQRAGFVVAEVAALDKKQGSFKQVTSANAVKQDLVISAYKPDSLVEDKLVQLGSSPESVWGFVSAHLGKLVIFKQVDGALEFVAERDPRRIYDRTIAWFVRHNLAVPISADEFIVGIHARFSERDGMMFLPEQIPVYEKQRSQFERPPQMELFVSDERSAIDWLNEYLRVRPSTYQEVHPDFTTQMGAGWKKHEAKPELSALLENNFLKYDGTGEVPSQIHTYLSSNYREFRGLEKSDPALRAKAQDRWFVPDPNKAQDLEKKREKALLKEFDGYVAATGRKLKEFRLEVLRAGFKTAWASRDYQTIIKVAQKIPEEALQEDEKLLLWYDQALTRVDAAS